VGRAFELAGGWSITYLHEVEFLAGGDQRNHDLRGYVLPAFLDLDTDSKMARDLQSYGRFRVGDAQPHAARWPSMRIELVKLVGNAPRSRYAPATPMGPYLSRRTSSCRPWWALGQEIVARADSSGADGEGQATPVADKISRAKTDGSPGRIGNPERSGYKRRGAVSSTSSARRVYGAPATTQGFALGTREHVIGELAEPEACLRGTNFRARLGRIAGRIRRPFGLRGRRKCGPTRRPFHQIGDSPTGRKQIARESIRKHEHRDITGTDFPLKLTDTTNIRYNRTHPAAVFPPDRFPSTRCSLWN